jgi:hypothetical protein
MMCAKATVTEAIESPSPGSESMAREDGLQWNLGDPFEEEHEV